MARVSLVIIDAAQAYAQIVGYVFRTYYRDTIALLGVAHECAAALELAARARPDIALLDFHAPGLRLIPELQRALGHNRIIVLGSDTAPAYSLQALSSGARAYLPKSTINTCLLPTIAGLIEADQAASLPAASGSCRV